MDSHPHLGPKEKRSRSKSLEGRDPFVWRRAEEGLLGRRPDAAMAEAEHHHSNCNHRDGPAAAAQMYRSKSMANLAGGAVGHGLRPASSSASRSRSRGRSRERRQRGERPPPPPMAAAMAFPHGPAHRRSDSSSPPYPHSPPSPSAARSHAPAQAPVISRDYHNHHPPPPPPAPPHPPPPPPPEPHHPHSHVNHHYQHHYSGCYCCHYSPSQASLFHILDIGVAHLPFVWEFGYCRSAVNWHVSE